MFRVEEARRHRVEPVDSDGLSAAGKKKIEESARIMEEAEFRLAQMMALFNQMTEGVVVFDPPGHVLAINKAALAMHHYPENERPQWNYNDLPGVFTLSTTIGERLLFEDWPISRVMRGEKLYGVEVWVRRLDVNHEFIASYSGTPIYDSQGQMVYALITFRDVTGSKRAQDDLVKAKEEAEKRAGEAEESRRILDALMEHIPMGIAIAEAPGVRIRMVSRWGREMIGALPDDPDLTRPERWQLFRTPASERAVMHEMPLPRVVMNGEVITKEVWYLTGQDGHRIPILCNAAPIRNSDGKITGGVIGWQDIRERLQDEERLKHFADELARSNRELEQFARVASHDLLEPLRMVSGFVQLLQDRYQDKLDASAKEWIGFAVEGAGRMKTLIEGLLDYSRLGGKDLVLVTVGLESLLDEVLMNLKVRIEENGAAITHDPLPVMTVDAVQMTQVFQNLIGNALKFRGDRAPAIHVGAAHQQGHWLFSVCDNGIGIDPAHSDRIFEVFQRLHTHEEYEGTGLGLAICKKIVERHGGRIWVESQSGQGSTFYFTLPDVAR